MMAGLNVEIQISDLRKAKTMHYLFYHFI